jgi:hypothetical protein
MTQDSGSGYACVLHINTDVQHTRTTTVHNHVAVVAPIRVIVQQ